MATARETAEDRIDSVSEGVEFIENSLSSLTPSSLDSMLRLLQIQVADAQVHATLALVDAVQAGGVTPPF